MNFWNRKSTNNKIAQNRINPKPANKPQPSGPRLKMK